MPSTIEILGAALFALAVVHTFATKFFQRLAHTHPAHTRLWHVLGEIEWVFGIWAVVLMVVMALLQGPAAALAYVASCQFTEPLFVLAIMVVAGTQPVLQSASCLVHRVAQCLQMLLPLSGSMALTFAMLSVLPLLGSFITEPAAMTLAALMLRDQVLKHAVSERLKYAALGVLLVNVSIGGTLTSFAAPPVLMVAAAWQWDSAFMLSTFGGKAALAVCLNAAAFTALFREELSQRSVVAELEPLVPMAVRLVHLVFLGAVVLFAHQPWVFLGLLLMFWGFNTVAPRVAQQQTKPHASPLMWREALMVACFLAGLVVLGRMQAWWLQPVLSGMPAHAVYWGATALTAVTDNAALTYLGTLLEAPAMDFKVALVAGAVTGGGLTLIANAPNPAGAAILKDCFSDGVISPLGLFLAALPATAVAIMALRYV